MLKVTRVSDDTQVWVNLDHVVWVEPVPAVVKAAPESSKLHFAHGHPALHVKETTFA